MSDSEQSSEERRVARARAYAGRPFDPEDPYRNTTLQEEAPIEYDPYNQHLYEWREAHARRFLGMGRHNNDPDISGDEERCTGWGPPNRVMEVNWEGEIFMHETEQVRRTLVDEFDSRGVADEEFEVDLEGVFDHWVPLAQFRAVMERYALEDELGSEFDEMELEEIEIDDTVYVFEDDEEDDEDDDSDVEMEEADNRRYDADVEDEGEDDD